MLEWAATVGTWVVAAARQESNEAQQVVRSWAAARLGEGQQPSYFAKHLSAVKGFVLEFVKSLTPNPSRGRWRLPSSPVA